MYLKELNSEDDTKCICTWCGGTGLHQGYFGREDIATLCQNCNGRGYNNVKPHHNVKYAIDKKTGTIYEIKIEDCNITGRILTLFSELKRLDNIKYVTFNSSCSSKSAMESNEQETEVIKYDDFIGGKLPIPTTSACPFDVMSHYDGGYYNMKIRCDYESKEICNCRYYGHSECWDRFYGDAKTPEERQEVLRRYLGR